MLINNSFKREASLPYFSLTKFIVSLEKGLYQEKKASYQETVLKVATLALGALMIAVSAIFECLELPFVALRNHFLISPPPHKIPQGPLPEIFCPPPPSLVREGQRANLTESR